MDKLRSTREFWDRSPCGGHDNLADRHRLRYEIEPWLLPLLKKIAGRHEQILEIGCGQGTDGIYLCSFNGKVREYFGLDYSDRSIEKARQAATETKELRTTPIFRVGDAEKLEIESSSREAVLSIGVLHHTADIEAAIAEIYRVLRPNGKAYIAIYRKWSLKVSAAKLLRGLQTVIDSLVRTDRFFYHRLFGRHAEKQVGTMFLECFGVPYMNWYSQAEMKRLFSRFHIIDLRRIGYNIPRSNPKGHVNDILGYFWLIEIQKSV